MKSRLEDLSSVVGDSVDLLLCSASFEPRSTCLPLRINPLSVNRALIGINYDRKEIIQPNADVLTTHFGGRAECVETLFNDPLRTADSWSEALNRHMLLKSRVIVDVTTFTREALLIVVRLLKERDHLSRTMFIYNGAGKYNRGKSDNEEIWLSKGITDVRSVLGYSGNLEPGRSTHFVVLAGFETERATLMIESMEPNYLSLGIGSRAHSISDEHYKNNLRFAERIGAVYGPRVSRFEFSPNDALATEEALSEVLSNADGRNVVVAPLNTKISTLGAALLAFKRDDVQIAYAPAAVYNTKDYASPSDYFYAFNLED